MGITAASSTWRIALPALAIALLALLVLYRSTVVSMMAQWWYYETYAHGILVVPIVLYMIWTRRNEVAIHEPHIVPMAISLLLLISLGWLVANAAEVMVIQHLAVVAMIQVTIYALLGQQVTGTIIFPLAYLLFAVPVGEALIPPLQQVTAWFTVAGLRLTGIPVLWEGLYLTIPTGNFEVAAACSGLRYLIASVALGFLYAYLTYRSVWRRLAFIALSMIMPIVANGLRAYGIVMIAHLSDMEYATGIDHLIYGWLFFGLVVLLMFWIGSFWREASIDDPPSNIGTLPVAVPLIVADTTRRYTLWTLAIIFVVVMGPLWALWTHHEDLTVVPISLAAPPAISPWQQPDAVIDTWEPQFSGADAVVHDQYLLDGQRVYLYIAYYRQQRPDAKLISGQNSLYDRKHWRYVAAGDGVKLSIAGRQWPLQATLLTDGQQQRLVWSGYWEGGQIVVSPYIAKLWEAWDQLSGAQHGSALIAVAANYEIQPDDAEKVLQQFLEAMGSDINMMLMSASGRD